jgi:hypothetical protein
MRQRVPRRAWYRGGTVHRPRVLVEDDHPALAISDFSLFQQAGFDVAWCSGPGDDRSVCPVLRGRECTVAARADIVLHGLDPRLGIAPAIARQVPGLPVLVAESRSADGSLPDAPAGCLALAFPCSVPGQIQAARRAVARRAR